MILTINEIKKKGLADIGVGLIRLYQGTWSKITPSSCRYKPNRLFEEANSSLSVPSVPDSGFDLNPFDGDGCSIFKLGVFLVSDKRIYPTQEYAKVEVP